MEKLHVIKIGGNVIDSDQACLAFLKDFSAVEGKKILVHGGGKIATSVGNKLGVESKYIDGRRITDSETIDLVTMVYGGLINKKLVSLLQSFSCNAFGITGADGNLIPATKRAVKQVDYGWVGDVDTNCIDAEKWRQLLDANYVPVVAPLTHDGMGHLLNTNADTIASVLAVAMAKLYEVSLIFCFEKEGVLADITDENSVIPTLNPEKYLSLKKSEKLFSGILPKIENAFDAIKNGVRKVVIGNSVKLTALINGAAGTTLRS